MPFSRCSIVSPSGLQIPSFLIHYWLGHALLWAVGIEHGDISEKNLMWDPATGKPKLCDFDLSHFSSPKQPTGHSLTGTWMFMALDLLTDTALHGDVAGLYRHDAESFGAVLLWVICRYLNGRVRMPPPLQNWAQPDFHACRAARADTYEEILSMANPDGVPFDIWKGCIQLVAAIDSFTSEAGSLDKSVKLGLKVLTADEKLQLEQSQSVQFVGFLLDLDLFKIGDGPSFVARIKQDVLRTEETAVAAGAEA